MLTEIKRCLLKNCTLSKFHVIRDNLIIFSLFYTEVVCNCNNNYVSTSSDTPVTWPLKRLAETVLTQFDTDDPRQCFIQCSTTPICIGQDILHYQSGTYRCRLLTISGASYASNPTNLVTDPCISSPCSVNGTCVSRQASYYVCVCQPGSTGTHCERVIDCGMPANRANSRIWPLIPTTTYGSDIAYMCNSPGYWYGNGVYSLHSTCQADGTWSTVTSSCILIDCGTVPTLNQSTISSPLPVNTTYNSNVSYTCVTNYRVSPGVTTQVITCLQTGVWTPSLSLCTVVDCGQPSTIANAQLIPANPATVFNTTVVYQCNTGYVYSTGVTNKTSVCQANGNWTTVPSCSPIDCGTPPYVSAASVTSSATTYGSVAKYTCYSYYWWISRGVFSQNVTCQANGSWAPIPTCSVIDCGAIPVVNQSSTNPNYCNTTSCTVQYTCNTGYSLPAGGTTQNITCQSTGVWTTPTQCADTDECATSVLCYNGATCINTAGSYTCQCPQCYSGSTCIQGTASTQVTEANFGGASGTLTTYNDSSAGGPVTNIAIYFFNYVHAIAFQHGSTWSSLMGMAYSSLDGVYNTSFPSGVYITKVTVYDDGTVKGFDVTGTNGVTVTIGSKTGSGIRATTVSVPGGVLNYITSIRFGTYNAGSGAPAGYYRIYGMNNWYFCATI